MGGPGGWVINPDGTNGFDPNWAPPGDGAGSWADSNGASTSVGHDGQVVNQNPDGTGTVTLPGGTVINAGGGSSATTTNTDGTSTTHTPGGGSTGQPPT